jgi:hypothetical protein
MITTLKINNDIKTENKYSIVILGNDIEGGFQYNQYYKVQIRFTGSNVRTPVMTSNSYKIDQWINNNLSNFS